MSNSHSPIDSWLLDRQSELRASVRASPWLSLAEASARTLEILLPHGNELYAALSKKNTSKAWNFWLPPDATSDQPKQRRPGRSATASLTLVATALAGETLDRGALLERLEHLHRRSMKSLERRGVCTLHIGLGLVELRDVSEAICAALVLIPVELVRPRLREPFALQAAGGAPFVNPALLMRLRDAGIELPPLRPGDALSVYVDQCKGRLLGRPGWQVSSSCVLAWLPTFPGLVSRDLHNHAAAARTSSILRCLAGEPIEAPTLSEPNELDDLQDLAFSADASQRMCIEMARRGHSFALLAPPGTGRTQTLANIVCDARSQGKSVLVVAERPGGLDDLAVRLNHAGLGSLITTPDEKRIETSDIRTPTNFPASEDHAPLDKLRTMLRCHVDALHRVRPPLNRTAWEVLADLASGHELPVLSLSAVDGQFDFARLSEASLAEYEQVLERLQRTWYVDRGCPWQGFRHQPYTAVLQEEVLGLLGNLQNRISELREAYLELAKLAGVAPPLHELKALNELLERMPAGVAPEWFAVPDFKQLAQDLDERATRFERFSSSLVPLTRKYGESIWSLPLDAAETIEHACQQTAELLTKDESGGTRLLAERDNLCAWAMDTQKRIPDWRDDVRVLVTWLGLPLPAGRAAVPGAQHDIRLDPSPAALEELLRLVTLCQSPHAPERIWVHNAPAIEKVRELVQAMAMILDNYRENRRSLLCNYTEDFFALNLDELARTYASYGGRWYRGLCVNFLQARRLVRASARSGSLPATVEGDLARGRNVLAQRRQLESDQARRRPILGRFEKGVDTDVGDIEKALAIAVETRKVMERIGCLSLPVRFVDVLCTGSVAPDEVRAAHKRLHESLVAWQQRTDQVRHLILVSHLADVSVLDGMALSGVVHYAAKLQAALDKLDGLIQPILMSARPSPVDLRSLLEDLRAAARLRAQDASQVAELAEWKDRFGPCYRGLSTDWNVLRAALAWTARMRGWFADHGMGLPPPQFTKLMIGEARPAVPHGFRSAAHEYERSLQALRIHFDHPGPFHEGRSLEDFEFGEVSRYVDTLRSSIDQLADWIEWRDLPGRLAGLGLSGFWNAFRASRLEPERLSEVFWHSFWTAWIHDVYRHTPELLDGPTHRCTAQEFRQREEEHEARTRARLATESKDHRAARPCLLMHPLTVVEEDVVNESFDLVVFDDASDLSLEVALPALCRARQAIVFGDAHAKEVPRGDESPLLATLLMTDFPRVALSSRYADIPEPLISLSNRMSHGTSLIGFPSARRVESCVELVHVNHPQNDFGPIVDCALEHLANHSEWTLGLVACDDEQEDAFASAIERRVLERPELEGFMKRLVRCGSGRCDIVLMIVTRDSQKRSAARQSILQARRKLVLVVEKTTANDDVFAVLTAIEQVRENLARSVTPLHLEVQAAVRRLGYDSTPHVGVTCRHIDLAVMRSDAPHGYLLGIRFDGPTYAVAATTSERDRLWPETLERFGWKLHTIAVRDWVERRDEEIARLSAALRAVNPLPRLLAVQ